jgi:hypothetical protein
MKTTRATVGRKTVRPKAVLLLIGACFDKLLATGIVKISTLDPDRVISTLRRVSPSVKLAQPP